MLLSTSIDLLNTRECKIKSPVDDRFVALDYTYLLMFNTLFSILSVEKIMESVDDALFKDQNTNLNVDVDLIKEQKATFLQILEI